MKRMPSRRQLLAGMASGTAGALAGCIDESAGDVDDGMSVHAAFFALWDWTEQVGGDRLTSKNPVETGEMGHGWSPDGNIAPEIADSRAFFYLDTPEFSWAQEIADELDRDYENVAAIDLLDGLGPYLLPFDGGGIPEPDHGHDYPVESVQFDEFDVYDLRSNEQLGYWHTDHWHGGVPDVPVDGTVPVGVVLFDDQERVVPLGENEPYHLRARVADGHETAPIDIESAGDHVVFRGLETGTTAIVFEVYHEGDPVYDTSDEPATVTVVADQEDDGASVFHDPHTWVDPVLAGRMVHSIAEELAAIDPDGAEVYRDNAGAYVDRLNDVHEAFERLAATAERDVAVFAAHDSFRYVEDRYGFTLHTPTGVSPDAAESIEDISGLLSLIDDRDINVVLYDPFESPDPGGTPPQMVGMLLENSDAEKAVPLTPVEGTTEAWAERDWGWIEQMEEINLPSLRVALDAE